MQQLLCQGPVRQGTRFWPGSSGTPLSWTLYRGVSVQQARHGMQALPRILSNGRP